MSSPLGLMLIVPGNVPRAKNWLGEFVAVNWCVIGSLAMACSWLLGSGVVCGESVGLFMVIWVIADME